MNDKIRVFLEYTLVLCIILEFNTPYTFFPFVGRTVQILPIFLLLGLILISNYSLNKKVNGNIFIYLIGALVPMYLLRSGTYFAYIRCLVLILPLMWIYLYLRKNARTSTYLSLFLRFSNIIVILAIISLIMWTLCSLTHTIHLTAMFPNDWNPNQNFMPSYYNIYFETQQISFFGKVIWRNSGIFNEAPMHNMVLCTALLIECFIRPIKSKTRIWILVVTILSTLTTTSQIFLLFIGGWFLYNRINRRYRALLILALPLLLYGEYVTNSMVIETKIETGGESSYNKRSDDIRRCIEIGLDHPLIGVGIITEGNIGRLEGVGIAGFSNSLFTVFARGGLYVLALYVGALLFIPFRYYRKYKDNRWALTMLGFFLIFAFTISFLKYLTFLFLAWGLSNIDLVRWKGEDEL